MMMMVALNGSIESAGVMDDNEVPEIEVPEGVFDDLVGFARFDPPNGSLPELG